MPTIFAIDGAEDSFYGFGELGAYSSSVASLQQALISLGQKVGDATLSALVLDGLIGPKTTAAANRAFAMYVSGAPANFATGTLTQSQVSTNASSLASYVNTELSRRGGAKTTALVPAAAAPAAVAVRAAAPAVSDSSAQIVKWASIGLGGVVVASVLYMLWRRQQGRSVLRGCDLGADEPSQHDMFYRAGRQRAQADGVFLHLVKTGLTAPELEKLIAKRPSVWGKYRNWLDTLPKRHGVGPDRFKR
jgi:peptidoglycan hydrolase-like protein with peptidoglycan-binding domain